MKRAVLAGIGLAVALAARDAARNAGATCAERRRSLPGDEAVPGARGSSTMATTIAAPPEAVWPWLVQMGCGRAGWYSWDRLDNGGAPSADEIHPEWQELAVGDRIPSTPDGGAWFEVVELEPERTLVLRAPVDLLRRRPFEAERPRCFSEGSWAFVLDRDGDRTRLVVRSRGVTRPRLVGLVADALFWTPAHVVMQRRQLRNLARLAASHYNASEEPEPVEVAVPA
jgi:proline iminopeptidase